MLDTFTDWKNTVRWSLHKAQYVHNVRGGGGLKNQILWGNRRRESEVPLETIWRLHCPEAEMETQRVNRGAHMTHEWQSWDSNSHSALSFRKTEG